MENQNQQNQAPNNGKNKVVEWIVYIVVGIIVFSLIQGVFGLFDCGGNDLPYKIVSEKMYMQYSYGNNVRPVVEFEIENTSNKTVTVVIDVSIYCDGEVYDTATAGLINGGLLVLMADEKGTAYAEGSSVSYFYYNQHEWTYKITNQDCFVK